MARSNSPLGKLTISPDEPVQVGSVGTWVFALTVGDAGIATGGGFRIMPPVAEPRLRYMLVRWQLNTVLASGPPGSHVCTRVLFLNAGQFDGAHAQIVDVRNKARALRPGEVVSVTLKHAVACRFPLRGARFETEIDPTGAQLYSCTEESLARGRLREIVERFRLPDPPAVDVVAGPPTGLRAAALPCPDGAGAVRITVSARDAFLNRATGFRGTLLPGCTGEGLSLPPEVELSPADEGARTFEIRVDRGAGVCRVHLKAARQPIECVSSPIVPDFPMPVFFGDVHCHNWIDRSPAGAEELYRHARDVAGLEFVAMTDSSADRTLCRDATREHDQPGRFVTLFAEEWADNETADHRNVYYRGDPGTAVARAGNSFELFERFRGQDVLVVPHTTNIDCLVGWKHTEWSRHDPTLQRLVEICQIRGDCEEEGPVGTRPKGGHGGSVRTALARGLRLGFVGGSDTHRTTAGGPGHELHPLVESTVPGFWGQTAVLAPELTRGAVFDALRERRCYATTGARILLWTEVNGRPMGSEIEASGGVAITVRCHAEAPIEELAVVKNGRIWARLAPDDLDVSAQFEDALVLSGPNYYYVRVTQRDGHRAWSSPVWVDS